MRTTVCHVWLASNRVQPVLGCRISGGRAATFAVSPQGDPVTIEQRTELLRRGEGPLGVRLFGAVVRPIQVFLHTEAAGGVLLLGSAVVALVWANVNPATYQSTFDYPLAVGVGPAAAHFTLRQLINDGFM